MCTHRSHVNLFHLAIIMRRWRKMRWRIIVDAKRKPVTWLMLTIHGDRAWCRRAEDDAIRKANRRRMPAKSKWTKKFQALPTFSIWNPRGFQHSKTDANCKKPGIMIETNHDDGKKYVKRNKKSLNGWKNRFFGNTFSMMILISFSRRQRRRHLCRALFVSTVTVWLVTFLERVSMTFTQVSMGFGDGMWAGWEHNKRWF